MLPAEIITKAQFDTHTAEVNYPAATKGIEALNIVSDYINNEIVQSVKEDYFWDRLKVDTVEDQIEYNIVSGAITWGGEADVSVNIKKVNKVLIKYATTDVYYTRMDYINPELLDKDPAYYADNQQEVSPFFYIQDRSIFIYPKPTEAITQGLQMNAIYSPPAIELASLEPWLPLQQDKHYIYSLGMEWQIYKSQGKLNEANNAKQIFEQELIKTMKYMKSRNNAPVKRTVTGLGSFR